MNAEKSHTDSRQALIEASLPIFAKSGLDGATVKDIADSANVNVAMISYHFGGKEGLYRAALESVARSRLEAAERMLKPPRTVEEFRIRLKMFAEEFLLCHIQNKNVMKIIHRDFDGHQPIALEVFKGIFLEMFNKVREFLESAVEAGIVRRQLNEACFVTTFFGGMIHAVRMNFLLEQVLKVSLKDPVYASQFIDQMIDTVCFGIVQQEKK